MICWCLFFCGSGKELNSKMILGQGLQKRFIVKKKKKQGLLKAAIYRLSKK